MSFDPMARVLALTKRTADGIAAEAANHQKVVENLDDLIAREMEPDAEERRQLAECEAAIKMLRDRIAAREEKVATLREQRAAAEEERAELAAQAQAAAEVVELARGLHHRQQVPAGHATANALGSPMVTRRDPVTPNGKDGEAR